ncbi:MAG TPA: DinB family protein [Chitinophagaceae bacterium]|nr:DinB family protein [Chitinophagaceae bacterium]
MPGPDLTRVADYFHTYTNKVPENDLSTAFKNQSTLLNPFFKNIPEEKIDYRYAEGKWTVKEMLQHLIDAERVFAYRALCFARKDSTPLPSFDENLYADNSQADKRDWNEMLEEFWAVRKTTEMLFNSFDDEQLDSSGIASNNKHYVLGLGYIIVGHVNHHVGVLKERYF